MAVPLLCLTWWSGQYDGDDGNDDRDNCNYVDGYGDEVSMMGMTAMMTVIITIMLVVMVMFLLQQR